MSPGFPMATPSARMSDSQRWPHAESTPFVPMLRGAFRKVRLPIANEWPCWRVRNSNRAFALGSYKAAEGSERGRATQRQSNPGEVFSGGCASRLERDGRESVIPTITQKRGLIKWP